MFFPDVTCSNRGFAATDAGKQALHCLSGAVVLALDYERCMIVVVNMSEGAWEAQILSCLHKIRQGSFCC